MEIQQSVDRVWLGRVVEAAASKQWTEDDVVERLRTHLAAWAVGFAARRADVQSSVVSWPRRGLHPDEAASFLRAMDDGLAEVDDAGYVTVRCARPKTPVGRYALLAKNGSGVSVNLEYLIQIGAVAELSTDYGWAAEDLDFERSEFDALGSGPDGRTVLAMEAKARLQGPDGLEKLLSAWLDYQELEADEIPANNAGRKFCEVQRLTEAGPVLVWLVAAGVRWAFTATSTDGTLVLNPTASPVRQTSPT